MKQAASKYVVHEKPVLSQNININTLIVDLVRIMNNVSLQCELYETKKQVQKYTQHNIQFSEYDQKARVRIFRSTIFILDSIMSKETSVTCPRHRSNDCNKVQRIWDKENR